MEDLIVKYWIEGLLIVFVAFCIRLSWQVSLLVKMHEHADRYSFGTVALTSALGEMQKSNESQAQWMEDISVVIRWLSKEVVKKEPPPMSRHSRADTG